MTNPWNPDIPDLSNMLADIIDDRVTIHVATKRMTANVAKARGAGASWRQIGSALDVTAQAAQQRFGRAPE